MALLAASVNNAKGVWFGLNNPDVYTKNTALRATKAHNRDVAGVFLYMQHPTILDIFQTTSKFIEDSCLDFDQHYTWTGVAGELGRPNRAPGQPQPGLRDLWCYFIDQYLHTIEANAATWSMTVQQTLARDANFAGTEGQNFLNTFFTLPIVTNMNFAHTGTGVVVNNVVQDSLYGAWDSNAHGPAGPFV
jgi:hypothetical protein